MLVQTVLKAQIKALLVELSQQTDNQPAALDKFADRLSTAITSYIKTATVTVNTTGTAAAQTGIGIIS